MGKTLIELFKGSPQDKSVKAGKETLIEQETSGIRVKSLVELNNPLIYGNEAVRIVQRSTPLLEDMKSNTGGSEAGGGLIGGKINQARDFVNSKLGIPEAQIPSRVVDKINEKSVKKEITSSDPIDTDIVGANGTGLGKFLKDSGGGNPKTIGKQALGNGIGLVKDKIRGKLFGEPQTIGEVAGEPTQLDYNNTNPYTKVLTDNRDYKKEGGTAKEFTGIDLTLVSPIHGTKRKETIGKFGKSEYAFEQINDSEGNPIWNQSQTEYDPTNPYSGLEGAPNNPIKENSLENRYGLTNGSDYINELSPSDEYKKEDVEDKDLIPFWISHVGLSKKPMFFRTLITGLTETVSPSWNTNKFVGNPYNFYTYTGVERNVSFNLKMYCSNPVELAVNWEKITKLTQLTYPFINKEKLMNAPIISFRIGDIYNSKTAFIESLTYTIPDNSNWETDGEIGYLPKLIDVALTLKFIESDGAQYKPYGYKLSKDAVKSLNDDRQAANFGTNSRVNSNGTIDKVETIPAMDSRGIVKFETQGPVATPFKGLGTGVKSAKTSMEQDLGSPSEKSAQSAALDKLKK